MKEIFEFIWNAPSWFILLLLICCLFVCVVFIGFFFLFRDASPTYEEKVKAMKDAKRKFAEKVKKEL